VEHTGLGWGNLLERDHFTDAEVVRKIILKWISKTCNGFMKWINVAHYNDKWQAFVRALMNFRVPENEGNFLTNC
jgi:hypothetical protein